jgi:DtxR family manganese transport transcriptional regulator
MQKEKISLFFKGASSDDYLTAVYEICREAGGSARQVEIAAWMGFSKPSVLRGLGELVKKGLVTTVLDAGGKYAYLTASGHALAEKLLRRRRAVAALLEALGVSKADAAAQAHLWEHGISDETAAAMEKALTRAKTQGLSKSLPAAPAKRKNARRSEDRRPAQTAAARV